MINSNLTQYLTSIDNLRNLVRYQAAPRVSSETVAEHSFFVTAYTLKLYDYFDFDLEKALRIAILHDFAEAYISDVPHPIKMKFPKLTEELEKAEYSVNCEYISEDFANDLEGFNNFSTPEGCIVVLSDILSVITYSKYEIELGNSQYMKDVLNKSLVRINDMLERCTPYLREGKNITSVINEITNFVK